MYRLASSAWNVSILDRLKELVKVSATEIEVVVMGCVNDRTAREYPTAFVVLKAALEKD